MRLSPSNIYYFRYRAKGHGTLDVYDRAPLVIPLDIRGKSLLAINVHWLPNGSREPFVKLVLSIAEKNKSGRRVPRLVYELIKNDSRFKFAAVAIRRYLISGISAIQAVPPELWDNILKVQRYKARFARKSKGYRI